AGYGYGGYKTGESYPFFNNYGYAYPPQTPSARGGANQGYGARPRPEPTETTGDEAEPENAEE
ncbi:MAG TPA: hypothetical protein VHB99_05080, partial [Pirellulales bacterium]|nr:hypothetical protein [Pirellulales bacterium]